MPVQQATKVGLIINLKAAKTLSLPPCRFSDRQRASVRALRLDILALGGVRLTQAKGRTCIVFGIGTEPFLGYGLHFLCFRECSGMIASREGLHEVLIHRVEFGFLRRC